MPYITSETVKAKRKELRAMFPAKAGWKLSVRKSHHSGIDVTFLRGPVALTSSEDGYQQVNHFYIDDHACSPEAAEVLKKAASVAQSGQRTIVVDSDYGSVPNYYVHLQVGRWDAPYEVVS